MPPLIGVMRTAVNLDIFKSYDIRGIYPGELDQPTAHAIGRGFVEFLGVGCSSFPRSVLIQAENLRHAFVPSAS